MIFLILLLLTDLDSSFLRINGTQSPELFSIHISLVWVSWQTQKLRDLFEREKMTSHMAYITTCWKTRKASKRIKHIIGHIDRWQWRITVGISDPYRSSHSFRTKALIQEEEATLVWFKAAKISPHLESPFQVRIMELEVGFREQNQLP